jgi:integrase
MVPGMEAKTIIIKDRSGKSHVYGVFRPAGMDFGRNGIRKLLCSVEDARYKTTSSGKRARSKQEVANLINRLWAAKLEELIREKPKSPGSIRIKEAFRLYLEERQAEGGLSEYTVRSYARVFNCYLDVVGNHPIEEFKKSFQARFIGALRDRKSKYWGGKNLTISPETVNTYVTRINAFLLWAFENELTTRQFRLKRAKAEKKKKTAYSADTQAAVESLLYELASTTGKIRFINLYRAFVMISETGMRIGEVWSLELNRINLASRRILVRSVPAISYQVKERAEKDVAVSDYLLTFLAHDLKSRGKNETWYLDAGGGTLEFNTAQGVHYALKRLLVKHGLYSTNIKPWHGLRARVASVLIENKGIAHAKIQLGHADVSTTEAYLDTEYLDMTDAVNSLRNHSQITVPKLLEQKTQE